MPSKSKSPLLLIVFIAFSFFIAALIWKNFHADNSEEVYVKPITVESTPVKKAPKIVKGDIENIDSKNDLPSDMSMKDKIKVLESTLNLHLMYKNPEDVVKAIDYYDSQNDTAKVQIFTDFLAEKFPDYNY